MRTSRTHGRASARGPLLIAALLTPLLLSACQGPLGSSDGSAPTATQAPPIATPLQRPAIHQIALGQFMANAVFPGPDGLILYGAPGSQPPHLGQEGAPAVYFYDFASSQVITIAKATPAPDGTARGAQIAMTAGDWVVYQLADGNGAHWSLWAVNVRTGAKTLVDSYVEENSAPLAPMYGLVTMDAGSVVWSVGVQTTGAPVFSLHQYTFASGSASVLISGPDTPILAPRSLVDGTILLSESHDTPQATDGLYLWTPSGSKRISGDSPVNAHMNSQYVVWDNPQARSLALYNRATGQVTETWQTACIRPDIALDRPYVVCLDYDHTTLYLVQAPSGQAIDLSPASGAETGAIANGRDYWVAPSSSSFNNIVDYVDLPSV